MYLLGSATVSACTILGKNRTKQRGAGDGIRTHDILLGKQTLCQLSYTRTRDIIPICCFPVNASR